MQIKRINGGIAKYLQIRHSKHPADIPEAGCLKSQAKYNTIKLEGEKQAAESGRHPVEVPAGALYQEFLVE